MYISQASKTLTTLCFFWQILIIFATTTPPENENIAISCGSSINTFAPDLRLWIGEPKTESSFPLGINGRSSTSKSVHNINSLDSVPYKTARISRHEFTYVFTVKPGQKFIRLHFNHDDYESFERSKAIFTVKAGPYTLLTATLSSVSLTSEALGGLKQVKEYSVSIEDQELTIKLSPAKKKRRSDDFYAFINGIEVVSMPTGLYFTAEGELGARVVGQKHRFYIDNTIALETVQRLNIGGPAISPAEDSNMFRGWDGDGNYLEETGVFSASESTVSYGGIKKNFAPSEIYQTTRSMYGDSKFGMNCLTWRIPVDLGFRFLIRLHFSEFLIAECRSNEFSILINNQIVEDNPGASQLNPVYRDYIVLMEGDKMAGKRNLSVTFQAKFESRDKKFHGTLNGLEVFKLSNPDNSLAGIKPFPGLLKSTPTREKSATFYNCNLPATVITVILVLLNIVVYHLRRVSDSNCGTRTVRSSADHPCRQFSIDEIRLATNDFDPEFHIGSGGYGRVYKGSIDMGATVVAVKRLKFESRQGDKEFWTEIKMLSKIRHQHLVSLIGYCNDGKERLLVYQYMSRGTLSDHLYKIKRHRNSTSPLSWEIRLKILIGAARGLYYLHSRHRVIHRDVKSSNILLDENWVAKISDFGLSKMGPANDSFTHISTNVKGTFGYLDPEYFLTRKLTRKSDVYAFGVVLFEVLAGRPALNIRLEEERRNLAEWARYCIREGQHGQLVDTNLIDQISPPCLKVFLGIAGRCLHTKPQERPAMADVAMGLELALAIQQNPDQADEEEHAGRISSDHSDGVIAMDDIIPLNELEIERLASGDLQSNKGSDQKNAKARTKDSDSPTRWWWDPFGVIPRSPSKPKSAASMASQVVIQQFSFQEIQKATNNFHNSLVIGFGGADSVYRGYIDGGQKGIAIRRSRDTDSRFRMARELQSKKEFQTNYSLDQHHVVFLIGHCDTEQDMMLVYDYMGNGTLHDHLHETYKDPLTWKRRLEICIGAAKGLSYIHSNVKQTTLHRDLKSSNIWLDENWNPKVSDWGLCRKKGTSRVPTIARGKWGYMDSDYIRGEELTEKSYVYSLGLVLFEVLFADKDTDRWLEEDQVSLAQWIKSCMRGNLSSCIDPFLIGRTSPDSIKTFVETAGRCLLDQGTNRPSMSDIVMRLEVALKQQEAAEGNKGAQILRS